MRTDDSEARGQALVDAYPGKGSWYLLPYDAPSRLWNGSAVQQKFTLDDLAAVLTKSAEMRDALAVTVELLDQLADDDVCEYDHNDYCQAHGLHSRSCPHPLARQVVVAWRAVELEQTEADAP